MNKLLQFVFLLVMCNVVFENQNQEELVLRDFQEFLADQQHNGCKNYYNLSCITRFIKLPFKAGEVRQYKVLCGEKR